MNKLIEFYFLICGEIISKLGFESNTCPDSWISQSSDWNQTVLYRQTLKRVDKVTIPSSINLIPNFILKIK